MFGPSLEQAEQLFTAAAAVGYASRPILLFYGLSQAGRAVAAAATSAGNTDWKLSGHGIGVRNLSEPVPLAELSMSDKGRGSFTQLARLLGSSSLPRDTSFAQIWETIPDLSTVPLDGATPPYRPALWLDILSDLPTPEVIGWVQGLPRRDGGYLEDDLAEFLSSYPTLGSQPPNEYRLDQYEGYIARTHRPDPDSRVTGILRSWPMPQVERSWKDFFDEFTQPYRNDYDRWVFPSFDGGKPLRPLMAWWAILFTLSMLARYEPSNWVKRLNIDGSPDAVLLETALDKALDICPQLVLQSIRTVSRHNPTEVSVESRDSPRSARASADTPGQ